MPNVQDEHYTEDRDYRIGSPHLTHWPLYERLSGLVRDTLRDAVHRGMPPTVLEIGAGHGGFTEPVLAAGGHVTAVEMSEGSIRELDRRFGRNDRFKARHSPDGSLGGVADQFTAVMAISVLHHIPDYVGFVDQMIDRVAPGGAIIALQDPLWYSRRRNVHRFDLAAYFAWRLGRGDLIRGMATQLRRSRGVYDENNLADMVEYHVVRQGVDEDAVTEALRARFDTCKTIPYWSHQSRLGQRLGERVGIANTFGVIATNKRA